MRTAHFSLGIVLFLLPACDALEFEGKPADGAFADSTFTASDENRSDLVSVESACEAYCTVAAGCGAQDDDAACIADCVEPKLAAMGTQAAAASDLAADCTSQYSATMACAIEAVCEEFAACDQAVDEYVSCALTVAP